MPKQKSTPDTVAHGGEQAVLDYFAAAPLSTATLILGLVTHTVQQRSATRAKQVQAGRRAAAKAKPARRAKRAPVAPVAPVAPKPTPKPRARTVALAVDTD